MGVKAATGQTASEHKERQHTIQLLSLWKLPQLPSFLLTWLKSMVRLPSKHVNLPSFGVYLAVLSGLAPLINVEPAEPATAHAASATTASNTTLRRLPILNVE